MGSWCLVTATKKAIQSENIVQNLSLSWTEVTSDTTLALESIQAGDIIDGRIALNFFLMGQGRVYTIVNTSCYTYSNALGQGERPAEKLGRVPWLLLS